MVSANTEAGGQATLAAIDAPKATRQKTAIHIVLVMLDPKLPGRERLLHCATRWEPIIKTEFGRRGGSFRHA